MVFLRSVICASLLFVQTISAQSIGLLGPITNTLGATEATLVNGIAPIPFTAVPEPITEIPASFNGGGLKVTSYSPIPPSGITVQSDNLLVEGPLAVTGQMPFLGVVAVEGPLPATGQGAVTYNCGNGNVGIVGETTESGLAANLGITAGIADLGYNGLPKGLPQRPTFK